MYDVQFFVSFFFLLNQRCILVISEQEIIIILVSQISNLAIPSLICEMAVNVRTSKFAKMI